MPYLLAGPAALYLALLVGWPLLQALRLAFQDSAGGLSLAPVQRMLADLAFWDALRLTLLFALLAIPLQTALALAMALLLTSGVRWAGALLYLWSIPLAISDLASGVVWLSIFTERGYLNSVLVGLGLSADGFAFLSYEQPLSLFLCAVVAEVWRATALVMVILLAGLQLLPHEYAEAAEVFGAHGWRRLWHVTLPLLRPSLRTALVLRTILAFQLFAVVVVLAGRQLPVLAEEAFRWQFDLRDSGVAAAYALVILLLSLLFTLAYLWLLRGPGEQAERSS